MNIEELQNNLEQIFHYIKTVFLREYEKYLTPEKTEKIKSMNHIFRVDENTKFKLEVSEKILIGLDIENYIQENNLSTDKDLNDISIDGKIYIKSLVDYQDDIQILLSKLILKPIIISFVGKNDNALTNGIIDMIVEMFETKYNFSYIKPFPSKELEVVLQLEQIVGEPILYQALLNQRLDLLENTYHQKIDDEQISSSFSQLKKQVDKIYHTYYQRLGKVYLADSLYDYQTIDYTAIIIELQKHNDNKEIKNNHKLLRMNTALKSIENLKEHRILFDLTERHVIENALLEMKNLIGKPNDQLENSYQKMLVIENRLKEPVQKLWDQLLTHPLVYEEGKSFGFLVGQMSQQVAETKLLTDRHIKTMPIKNQYGFIYKRTADNVIYATTKDVLGKLVKEELNKDTVIHHQGIHLEVDEQIDSTLLTPDLFIRENIKDKATAGKIFLSHPTIQGIYVVYDNDFSKDYNRAKELSEKYELPLVLIDTRNYITRFQEIVKEEFTETQPITIPSEQPKQVKVSKKHLFKSLFFEPEENNQKIL